MILFFEQDASKMSDGFMEPHPLWEYPSCPLSDSHEIFSFDFVNSSNLSETINQKIQLPLKNTGLLNGIAIWHVIEYDEQDPSLQINTGLIEDPRQNQHLQWSKDYKQAVHILDGKFEITEMNRDLINLNCFIKFEPKIGKFDVDFKVNVQ